MEYHNLAYVDDDESYLFLLEREVRAFNAASRSHHVNLYTYKDPELFMEHYEENPAQFDCILLDILFEDRRGFDLLKPIWITEKPVIMVSNLINEKEDLPSMMPKKGLRLSEIISRYCKLACNFPSNVLQLTVRESDSRYAFR